MKADSKPEVVGGLQLTSVADLVAEGDDAPILNGGNAGGAGVDPLDSAGRRYVRKQRTAAVAAIITLVLVCVGVAVAIFISNRPSSGVPIPKEFSGRFVTYDRYQPQVKYVGRLHKTVSPAGRTNLELQMEYTELITHERIVVTLTSERRGYRQVYNDSISTTVPQRTECVPDYTVSPIGDIDELFNRATAAPVEVLDASNPSLASCLAAGNRWLIKWGAQEFVYCQPQDDTHVIAGDNFHFDFVADTSIQALDLSTPINVTSGEPAECEIVPETSYLDTHPDEIAFSRRRLITRRGLGVTMSMSMTSYTTKRPCLFVGGNGYDKDQSPKSSSSEYDYWGSYITGKLNNYCSSFKFIRRNFKSKPWTESNHAKHFCDTAKGMASSGGDIGSMLIFSHGAGSLLVANALNTGRCAFSSSTRWYSANAPFGGMEMANRGTDDLCPDAYSALKDILDLLYVCKGSDHDDLHTGIEAVQSSYTSSYTPVDAASELDGALCGDDAEGLYYSFGQYVKSVDNQISSWGSSKRDGFVKLWQCKTVKSGGWSSNNLAQWATLHVNFADGTCRFGDPYSDPQGNRSPCSWYQAMAARA